MTAARKTMRGFPLVIPDSEDFSRRFHIESILSSMSDSIILADTNSGRMTFANDSAISLLEICRSEIGDLNLFGLFKDCFRSYKCSLDRLMIMSEGMVRNIRVEVTGYNGKKTPGLLTVDVVPGDSGNWSFLVTIKDNSEAESLTFSDPLTGVCNRRCFDFRIQEECSRVYRGQLEHISLLFLDIDFFGDFNKKYGHRFGDTVLRAVAQVMNDSARLSDIVCRYGGEEFVIILPGTDEEGSLIFAERLRRSIEKTEVINRDTGRVHSVTATIGVSTINTTSHRTADQLIGEANEAMLIAKRRGRNRVLSFSDSE